jgi:hypothetical protein
VVARTGTGGPAIGGDGEMDGSRAVRWGDGGEDRVRVDREAGGGDRADWSIVFPGAAELPWALSSVRLRRDLAWLWLWQPLPGTY